MDLSDFNKDKQNFDHVSKDEQKVIQDGLQKFFDTMLQVDCSPIILLKQKYNEISLNKFQTIKLKMLNLR